MSLAQQRANPRPPSAIGRKKVQQQPRSMLAKNSDDEYSDDNYDADDFDDAADAEAD